MSNLWIWATVGAAFFQALRYAGLKTLNQSLSTGVTTYVRVFFTLPLLILYLVAVLWWTGEPVPRLSSAFMAYSAASSVAQFTGTLLVVRLFQLGNFAIATLIIKADVIMTALIGTAFFSEQITPVGWAAILVTIVGVIVISLGRQPISADARGGGTAGFLTNAAPTLIGLTSALIYSLSYLFLREAILVADPMSGPFVRSALAAVAMTGISVSSGRGLSACDAAARAAAHVRVPKTLLVHRRRQRDRVDRLVPGVGAHQCVLRRSGGAGAGRFHAAAVIFLFRRTDTSGRDRGRRLHRRRLDTVPHGIESDDGYGVRDMVRGRHGIA